MPRKFIAGAIIGAIISGAGIIHYHQDKAIETRLEQCGQIYLNAKNTNLPYVHPKIHVAPGAKWVTIAEIEESLKNTPPMNVGFDIDDTVMFPHAAFQVSYAKFCANDESPMKTSCTNKQKFWDYVNSIGHLHTPKQVGKELIAMHLRRGDNIFFITAREKSKYLPETMTRTLKNTFNIKKMNKVIYLGMATINTENPGKTAPILENNIKIFYGDSDADIAAAKAANIRGIRVIRAPNSQDNFHMPLNGRYNEEVIFGSDM